MTADIVANSTRPGLIVLLGSGETLASSGKIHEYVARRLPENPAVAILETPAGFEPNSDLVAEKIKIFLDRRLQNYRPRVTVLPARKRGTPFSPDNPDIVRPILEADEILLGPGSPTYGARQLRGSLASEMIAARHRLGAALFLSSSATLSFGRYTLPVYEIYKVGQDLHWQDGVDFFGRFGLNLTIIPHWDNTDGGDELDTSHCYIGANRYRQLLQLLPKKTVVVGVDEHTGLIIDPAAGHCLVRGRGNVTLVRDGAETVFSTESKFAIDELGSWHTPNNGDDIDPDVWQEALATRAERIAQDAAAPEAGEDVRALVDARQAAREQRDWATADTLRDEIAALGWAVLDTEEGPQLEPLAAESTQ